MRPEESFIGQPIRSLQTMLRIIAEADGTSPSPVPDGIYGPDTMAAVSHFQRRHGLPVTGITDQDTWEAIVAVHEPARVAILEAEPVSVVLNPNQVIRPGERHPVVFLLQAILAVLAGIYQSIAKPELTGILDPATSDALSSFQMLSGLPMTGSLDKNTWKQLAIHYPLASNLWITRGDSGNY